MAIIIKSVTRYSKPGDKESTQVNYATQVALGYVDIDEVARRISRVTSQAEGDVLAVLRELTYQIPEILKTGNSIRLGKFGSFSARVSSSATADANTLANAQNVRGLKVRFYPGVLLKTELKNNLSYSSLEALTAGTDSGSTEGDSEGSGNTSSGGGSETDSNPL